MVSFHPEQGAAVMMGAKGMPRASRAGENRADVSLWGAAASWRLSQRSPYRGPNRIRSRPGPWWQLLGCLRFVLQQPSPTWLWVQRRGMLPISFLNPSCLFLVLSLLPPFLILLSLPFLFSFFLSSAHWLNDPSHFLVFLCV